MSISERRTHIVCVSQPLDLFPIDELCLCLLCVITANHPCQGHLYLKMEGVNHCKSHFGLLPRNAQRPNIVLV